MKDAYYFSHDSNARNDLKIVKLRRKLGLSGVGLFWCIIEMLRESENYKLNLADIEDICYELRFDSKDFTILFECELLEKDDDLFWSKSLLSRMKRADNIRQKRREAGTKGGKSKAIAKQPESNCEALKEKKGKESKEKEKDKEKGKHLFKNSPYFDKITLWNALDDKYKKYDIGYYYEQMNNYSEQGKMYKNWLATLRSWINRDIKDGTAPVAEKKGGRAVYKSQSGLKQL
jgi:hypothetical protein